MSKKKVAAIIPARMGSTRFPGKPLAKIFDLPMIEHVRRRVAFSSAVDEVYVATCDKEIFDIVKKYGGKAVMTSNSHERCTDRVEEASNKIDSDYIVIVAGDEPLLVPEAIDKVFEPCLKDRAINCVNLLSKIENDEDFQSADVVKAVMDTDDNIMYFSRSRIPFFRSKSASAMLRQTGIQVFKKEFLEKYSKLKQTPLEIAESIDLLRILENGYKIKGVVYPLEVCAVDRPGDISRAESIINGDKEQKNIYQRISKQ